MKSLSSSSSYLQSYYQIPNFSSGISDCFLIIIVVREFLAYVAKARGKLKKGGIPDLRASACVVINDFNSGMIPFYIKPPRRLIEQTCDFDSFVIFRNDGLQIVGGFSKSFDMKSINDEDINVIRGMETTFDVLSLLICYIG